MRCHNNELRRLLLRQAEELRIDCRGVKEDTPIVLIRARVFLGLRRLVQERDKLLEEQRQYRKDVGHWIDCAATYRDEWEQAKAERDELLRAAAEGGEGDEG